MNRYFLLARFVLTFFLFSILQVTIGGTICSRLSIQNGLSNNSVRCVYQDSKGFMWMGTYDGINVYDGKQFKIFRNKIGDSTSLPHNYIYTIHEDKYRKMWIGTGQGLVIYDNIHENFYPVFFQSYLTKRREKTFFNASSIDTDEEGNMYVGTNTYGLLTQRSNEKDLTQVALDFKNKVTTSYSVQAIVIQRKKVFLFINKLGLCIFDLKTQKISLQNGEVKFANCMSQDTFGDLWIGTTNGVYHYSVKTNNYVKHLTVLSNVLSSNNITSICSDKVNNLWIGTSEKGVNILQSTDGSVKYIASGDGKGEMSSGSVYSIFSDNESRIWIGTHNGGCNVIDTQKDNFTSIFRDPQNKNTIPSNFIFSFCETGKSELMVGTDGGGLCIWDRNKNVYTTYKHDDYRPNSLSHNTITGIVKDYLGNIWLSTYGGGIDKFNKTTGTFERFICKNNKKDFDDSIVLTIYEDKDLNLWATTYDNGALYRLNRVQNRFEIFSQQTHNLITLFEDSRKNLWAGTPDQLIKIDKSGKDKHIIYNIGKPVRFIYEDLKHRLWIATEGGGLQLFDIARGVVTQILSTADGLCNNSVLTIEEDNQGYLWLSTFNGLSRFDPETKKFSNYFQGDGIQCNQFSYRAGIRLSTGEIALGGIEGFTIFFPDKIINRSFMPPIFLTNVTVNNKPIATVSGYISETSSETIQEIKIPYDQAVLSFSFIALEYTSPEKIKYAYFLQGWDKDWINTGNIRDINYSNLKEGSYILHVKNTDVNGVWNSKEITLSIIVLPPWYRSWLAYLVYISFFLILSYSYFNFLKEKNRLRFKIKLAQINADKEKEISESRLTFFTNVTHEFRTPLTLIINPIKDMLTNGSGSEVGDKLAYVYKNASRLMSLVDQLLLFRKTESGLGSMHFGKINLYTLCDEAIMLFSDLAKAKKIDCVFKCSTSDIEIIGDKEKLETVLYNLLSNAFKYTPDGGSITITLEQRTNHVDLSVSDTGFGIPEHVGDKVFDKYYRIQEKGQSQKPGFGIGLYLVREYLKMHNGTITYKSNFKQGTIFLLSLPIGKIESFSKLDDDVFIKNKMESSPLVDIETDQVYKKETDGLDELATDKRSILITDDNLQLREYLAEVFDKKFIVYEAKSAEEGILIAKANQPDIIISDVVMEDMSGIDFCKSVKESPALNHIPFILLTGNYTEEARLQSIQYGADDYISKPFDKDLLVARVNSLISKHQSLKKYFFNEITHQKHSFSISAEYKEFLEKCIEIVENNLDNDNFNNQLIAREIGMSYSKLYKLIKTISGQNVSSFVRYVRLRKAAELFINSNMNINETAFFVGFSDIKHFREQFTKMFGLRPSDYIEKYRKSLGKNYKLDGHMKKN